jgi:transcriptional regulator with XRE-family HTH domain
MSDSAMSFAVLAASDHQRECGLRLRQAITAAKIRQVDAAEIMGIPKNHLGNWLRGEAPIRLYQLYRLCRVTGVTADWIVMGDPSGMPQRLSVLPPASAPEQSPAV